jgi:hypothetical protein
MVLLVIAGAGAASAGCEGKAKKGLPAAKDWQAPTAGPGGAVGGSVGVAPSDPHAGVPGATPIGGMRDPHAGVPGAPPIGGGSDPHAGVPGAPPLGAGDLVTDDHGGMGSTVEQLGLPPPDPSRPIDASKFVAGTVTVPPALQAKVPVGATIFLAVRPAGPDGKPAGRPLAVDKLVATGTWPLAFRITEAQAMVGGTSFAGAVVVGGKFDQDGEALSTQPGDLTGSAKATIPADGLVISLDAIAP